MEQPKDESAPPAESAQELGAQELEQVSGGLPAVQKVREAAARMNTSSASFKGGVRVAAGDVTGDGQ